MSLECGECECERDYRGPYAWECSRNGPRRVRTKPGTYEHPLEGVRIGGDVEIEGMSWTPVLWDDEEDPDWHKTACLEFKTQPMPLEFDIGPPGDGSLTIDVDHEKKRVSFTWQRGERVRITRFPMHMVGNLCSVMLRECRVSTFRYSARTGRHQINVSKDMDVRDVAML